MRFSGVRRLLIGLLPALLVVTPAVAAPRLGPPIWKAHAMVVGHTVQPRQWMSPEVATAATTTGLVFIASYGPCGTMDQYCGSIAIFAQGNLSKQIGTITAGLAQPDSVAVDGHGVLYVANYGNSITGPGVTSYKPTKTHTYGNVYHTYNVPTVNIAVANDGTLYVADGAYGFAEFLPGQFTKPSLTAMTPDGSYYAWGIGVDRQKNVYLGMDHPPASGASSYCAHTGWPSDRVYKFAAGSTTGVDMGLTGLLGMGQIVFAPDNTNDMLVSQCVNPGTPSVVSIFPPQQTNPTGQFNGPGFLGTDAMAFNKAGTQLYVGNAWNNSVEELSYPGGQLLGRAIGSGVGSSAQTFGLGVAVYPPAP